MYLNEILCYDYFTVSKSHRIFIFLDLSFQQIAIILAAKLIDDPRTENSLLELPITPVKTSPVVIPI